jgi:hypothetical protein
MNRPARVTQADIARALRAIKQVDLPMVVEVLPNGTIRIMREREGDARPEPEVAEEKIVVL